MKCRVCKKRAVINLRAQNRGLCEECFDAYVLDRVERTIKRYKMFSRGQRILVAVSGGKDSLGLWDILARLGYEPAGLFVDMGITRGNYSARSREVVESFAQSRGLELVVESLEAWWGRSIEKIGRRVLCPTCGMAKRYLTNRVAADRGYDVLCTGHNLDDEAAVLLSNLLNWQVGYLARQAPVLDSWHPRLARKAKPLVLLTEKESALYTLLRGIEYVEEPCPYSQGATTLRYKRVLNQVEWRSPGTKQRFYTLFLKNKGLFEGVAKEEREGLKECKRCGQPTWEGLCAFCRFMEESHGDFGREVSAGDQV
ncbi:MAG: TIGR00269 family protein [Aquificota bacterium]|nr:MAG: TIGR00269 family protein [Aquificota bacterium]